MADDMALSLAAVGDIMLGDSAICVGFGFHSRYPSDLARRALGGISDQLGHADIVFGNLECSLATIGRGASRWRRDQMRGDPEYAVVLREAGFTALNLANNHAVQHGREAFNETLLHLRNAGILCVGLRGPDTWACEPAIQLLPNGRRIGLLGYCWRPRQYHAQDTPPFAEGSLNEVLADVERLRSSVDGVIVSLHWGEEFVATPSISEVTTAHALIEAGALAVLGHHPHVLRPCERFRDGIIAYSLGNFASDMVWQKVLRRGGILNCRWHGGRIQYSALTTTHLDRQFRPNVETTRNIANDPVVGMDEGEYRREIRRTVRAQQRAAYQYAATRLLRYPPDVIRELAINTSKNKIAALREYFRRRSSWTS